MASPAALFGIASFTSSVILNSSCYLKFAYGLEDAWWIFVISVTAGELLSATVIGALFLPVFDRIPALRRKDDLSR